jgi:hypothetical protein
MSKWKHRKVFDLAEMPRERRDVVQEALNMTDEPFEKLRQATGGDRVKVLVSDLSTYDYVLAGRDQVFIVELGRHGIVRGDPDAPGVPAQSIAWMPSRHLPAGAIELHEKLFDDPPKARKQFLREAVKALEAWE